MNAPSKFPAAVTAEEMRSRREVLDRSRHSLRLEGLDEFVTPEAEAEAEAWGRGEITLERAIENTLQRVGASPSSP